MDVLKQAAERGIRYLETLGQRWVDPKPEDLARLRQLHEPLPERPTPDADVIRLLDEIGSPATMATAGPRFFGFVIGGSLPATVAANWLAGAWDQPAGLWRVSPITAEIEDVALQWLLELLDLPRLSGGAFVTGATMANFTALAAARHEVLRQAGWDPDAQGLFGAPEITVIISEESHPSVIKSLGLLGLGRNRVVRASVDQQGRVRADRFPSISGPTIVCLQAGNVNTGAFDPLDKIIPGAQERGAWVHVDGAFGLWANAVPSLKHLCPGIAAADSWAMDAHKWLNVPYDSGLAFVKDARPLRVAMTLNAPYLPPTEARRDPSNFTPELSRRGRGIEIWAAIKALGRQGVAEMIERNCRQARRFAQGLRDAGFEILNDVVLNQVLVSFGSPEKTNRVIGEIQQDGTCFCGGTLWQGRTAMRISVSSWATTDDDVERSLAAMLRLAR